MIELRIGSKYINIDGRECIMDVAPFLEHSRTFVPVRFVSQALGYDVSWDGDAETVTITDKVRHFNTMNDCALDWAMRFNNLSIGLHRELGSTIYCDEFGYYYTYPNIGDSNRVVVSTLPGLEGTQKRLAIIHSHASTGNGTSKADTISDGDRDIAKQIKKDNYMVSPCGMLRVYRYATNKNEVISDLVPFDRRAKAKLEGVWKYGNMDKNDKYFAEYNVGKTSEEADAYNYLFKQKLLFPFAD